MKICFFFPPSFQWLNFIKSRLSNTFAVTMCTDARIPWRNEVTRLMRISVVRGTQREKTATVTLVQNDLWAWSECVWYTPWSWSCRICLNDIALLHICILQIFHIKPRQSFFESFHIGAEAFWMFNIRYSRLIL